MSAYTEADVQAAWDALRNDDAVDYMKPADVIRTVLDSTAPAIAARAQVAILREIADDYAQVDDSYLTDRADEIEAK